MKTTARPTADSALQALQAMADPVHAEFVQRYFKTAPGQYGAGDRFLGIRMPALRALVPAYHSLPLQDALTLLRSPLHEARLFALLVLVRLYERGDASQRKRVYESYLEQRAHINNWDLVDVSAPLILGRHLFEENPVEGPRGRGERTGSRESSVLRELARSQSLWDRRSAILATQYFIRQGQFDETLRLAELLLHDEQDLITRPSAGCCARSVTATARLRRNSCAVTRASCRAPCCATRSRSSRRNCVLCT